jgi:protocatechuate 3,4-dioxygenase beta subunit
MARARSVLLLAGLFLVSPFLVSGTAFAAGIPIRGRVLDSGGAALAKARVRLVPVVPAHAAGRLELEGKDGPEAVATVESGADGMFRLDAPEPGMWAVIAGGEGLVSRVSLITPLLAEVDLPAVRLPRNAGLTVRVTGSDGKPVPGARVRAHGARPKALSDAWAPAPGLAVTDAEGRAVLPREASAAVTVRAGRSGLIAERKEVRAGTLELRLDAGQEIPVRVLGADGKPVAGVLAGREEDSWLLGATDADGVLSLTAPGKPPLDISLLAADGRSLTARVHPFSARERPGARELRLPASLEFPARVVSAADGRPLAGALVWKTDDPGGFRRTDGRGETRLPFGGSGALQTARAIFVEAAAPGFIPDFRERSQTAGQRPASFSLQPDLVVTGVVVDEAGRPVAGAEISSDVKTRPQNLPIHSLMRIFRNRGRLVRSGPDGRFRWGGLVGGIDYELRVTKAGFAPSRIQAAAPAPDRPAAPLRVVLQRGRSAFGRVLGPGERPVAGAQVTLRTSVAAGPDRFRAALAPESLDTFEAVTGGDGRFELLHLPAGRYDLTARGRGWAPLTVPTLEIPEEDRATDLGTLVLAPGVLLEGIVVNPAGKPVEGAEIHVAEAVDASFPFPLPTEGEEPAGLSGLDGFFRIEDLRAGSLVNVSALRTGYAAGESKGVQVPAERPVRIILQEVGALSGRVVDPDGKPIAGAWVRVDFRPLGGRPMRFSGAPQQDESDPEGNFRIQDVTPGPVDLAAQAPGWQAGTVAGLELRSGEEKRGVEIVLSPAAILEGRVLTPSGEALPGAQVNLPFEESRGGGFHSATTDDEGRYVLESLPPGHRTLEASHPDYGMARRQAELRLGENTLDITLEGGSEVSGRVVDETGTPVAGAQVWLASLGASRPLSTMSQSDGGFRFAAVTAGNYRAGVEKEGFARSERVPVTVSGSSVGGLELRLTRGGALVGRITGVEAAELSRVQIVAWGRGMPLGGRVEPDGSYRIDRLGEGEWRVRAELPGTALYAEGEARLEPGASEARLDLEMERGLELSVRVRRNGAPVSGESLFLEGPARRRAIGETDAEGRYRFPGLAAGSYRVQLEDSSGGPGHEERVDLQTDREILIDLQTGEVTGRVVDAADARPLAGAAVQLLGDSGSVPRPVRTDSRGVFVLRGVGEGSWRLRAQADGYAPAEADVRIDGGGPADEVELSLRATEGVTLQTATAAGPPPRTLFYVVLDGAGRKIGDGTVAVGEAGRARLSRVPPGSWQVLLLSEDTAPLEIAVTSPGDAGRLTLPPPCTLRVKVPALADAPVPATVSLLGAGGRPFRTFARVGEPVAEWPLNRGTRSWSDIPPGTWEVRVTAADGRTWRATATTVPGVEAEAVLE